MRTPKNAVLVKLEKKSENEYVFSNGHVIHLIVEEMGYLDGSYNPNAHTRIYGDVAAIPDRLGKGGKEDSDPVWVRGNDARYIDAIVPEVLEGDRVYFYYTVVSEYNIIEWDGQTYYKVPYTQIICVVREDKIIPIGSHVLLEPYYGEGIVEENIDGHKVYGKKTSFGLFLPVGRPQQRGIGKVRHIGAPLVGDEQLLTEGDLVLFPDMFDVRDTIEGVEYYTMRQHEVLAII